MEIKNQSSITHALLDRTRSQGPEIMFCLCLYSIFLPVKVYPVIFLAASFIFFLNTKNLRFDKWAIFLTIYSANALLSFLITYDGSSIMVTNIVKLLVNFIFLYFVINWLSERDNRRLLTLVDWTFHLIFLLVFLQLVLYHFLLDFRLIYGSSSSGQASMLYNERFYFWGLDDKNMFGARIAIIGIPYILMPLFRLNKLSWWRICWIFLLAYLSMSRTPLVALMIGCFLLVWFVGNKRWRIILVLFLISTLPFVLTELIRIDQITASNDGMGVRLAYWEAFFKNLHTIPVLGSGFMNAPEFLSKHAAFYHGEPHIHNTFISNYLELGIIGFSSYIAFLACFYLECKKKLRNPRFWMVTFVPLLSIMMILYSGYDNDIVVYLSIIYLLGSLGPFSFRTVKMGI